MLLIAAHAVRACLHTSSIVLDIPNTQTALHGIHSLLMSPFFSES
jgi:hypothetical protein